MCAHVGTREMRIFFTSFQSIQKQKSMVSPHGIQLSMVHGLFIIMFTAKRGYSEQNIPLSGVLTCKCEFSGFESITNETDTLYKFEVRNAQRDQLYFHYHRYKLRFLPFQGVELS